MQELIDNLTFLEIIDVLLVVFLVYQVYLLIRGTIAIRIFLGIFFLYVIWKGVTLLEMKLLSEILGQFLGVGVLALIVVFQQEIRRFLLLLGNTKIVGNGSIFRRMLQRMGKGSEEINTNTNYLAEACINLSKKRYGALILIERNDELTTYSSTGLRLDAKLTQDLLESIFEKNAPLHDGAIIIQKDRIVSARCILPITNDPNIPPSFGLRHRAAIGVTEQTDTLAIVVSEETGRISTFCEGKRKPNITKDNLEVHVRGILEGNVF